MESRSNLYQLINKLFDCTGIDFALTFTALALNTGVKRA